MDKEVRRKNIFLLYALVLLGLVVIFVSVCFGIILLLPGTSVLGIKYVDYNKYLSKEVKVEDLVASEVSAVKVVSKGALRVDIFPGEKSDKVEIVYNQKYSGLIKTINDAYFFETKIEDQSFEGQDTPSFATLCIDQTDPMGFSIRNNSILKVYLPKDKHFSIVYVKSNLGDVNYTSRLTYDGVESSALVTSLYLESSMKGNVTINKAGGIDKYFLKTDDGNISFKDLDSIEAKSLSLEMNKGSFNFVSNDNNATLNLTDSLYVYSISDRGPTVKINKLVGNAKFSLSGGEISIDEIGAEEDPKKCEFKAIKANFNVGTIYGQAIFSGEDYDKCSNNIKINSIINSLEGQDSKFNIGKGVLDISVLHSDADITSTSGNITVRNVGKNNIYVVSDSGDIDISYTSIPSPLNNKYLTLFTKTGAINLKNVSVILDLNILRPSNGIPCDISFVRVPRGDSTIDAFDRDVNIFLETPLDGLYFRLITKEEPTEIGDTVTCSKIKDADPDYPLNSAAYEGYIFAYRVGYTPDDTEISLHYDLNGILLIDRASSVYLTK